MNKMLTSIGAVSVALVAAAILASSAQADRPDDRAGLHGIGAVSTAIAEKPLGDAAVRPDDRGTPRGVGSVVGASFDRASVRPDDRGEPRPVALSGRTPRSEDAPGDAFQWKGAMVGAGLTVGVFLLAAALAFTVRQRRRIALS